MNVSFEGKMFCSQDIEVLVFWMNSQTEYTLEVILVCFFLKKKNWYQNEIWSDISATYLLFLS